MLTLIVRSPRQRKPERAYIYEVLLSEFLGLPYRVEYEDRNSIEISVQEDYMGRHGHGDGEAGGPMVSGQQRTADESIAGGDLNGSLNGSVLGLADMLLQVPEGDWLTPRSLPKLPLDHWDAGRAAELGLRLPASLLNTGGIPVLYGLAPGAVIDSLHKEGQQSEQSGPSRLYLERTPKGLWCGIDLFGGSFFMLTRYEELADPSGRDEHDRSAAAGSVAARAGFLNRPIVNEYAELLWAALHCLWPGLQRRPRRLRLRISHDVDVPYLMLRRSRSSVLKESLADLIRRRSLEPALRKARAVLHRAGNYKADPFNRFDWLMSLSETAGVQSSFYFITEDTAPGMDGNYTMEDPEIRSLLREIHLRGHRIGLHPGYETYLYPERIARQFGLLREAAEAAGIRQDVWGGRQHYLRWRAPDTWQHWEAAGLDYDSTLSYADQAGFRCGTCYEYPVFNLRTRQMLHLRERPLIVMEQSILQPEYMGLRGQAAVQAMRHYFEQCAAYEGDFTLLWHNSHLVRHADRRLYWDCMQWFGQDAGSTKNTENTKSTGNRGNRGDTGNMGNTGNTGDSECKGRRAYSHRFKDTEEPEETQHNHGDKSKSDSHALPIGLTGRRSRR
ncbi:polysaccharide deacetylase family protein [Paenibacillus physcomitrellae]|uniref:Polysaccharide deacetylase n=1 Tax=Paenibacillus physcomitrellae TaxID=1619311 RepID=A0ABQ1FXP5_9BACL|nr:polysaccharide deacetylase family protein [Paenibacillus physcomitrellae]GGA33436.1 polysaccharide deacetylase [Paenibacillus physcomitrellae]